MKLELPDFLFLLSVLLIIGIFAVTENSDYHWTEHAIAGILSFLFSVYTTVLGATLKGRVLARSPTSFGLHRKLSIYLTILVLISVFSGLYSRVHYHESPEPFFWQHATPFATVLQGWFGLFVTILALLQLIPCIVRRRNSRLHMILGYTLTVSLAVQIILGIGAVLVEVSGG